MTESSMEVPQNLKTELLYDLEILLLGIYAKKTNSQNMEYTCLSMDEWIKKLLQIDR